MKKRLAVRTPSPAMVVSLVALFVALSGTGYAAFDLPQNSVGTAQLQDGAVSTSKLKDGAVTAAKLNPAGVTVPNATRASSANTASSATNATNATHASNADTASSATKATNATHASSADSATTATNATNAIHANSADTATSATNASSAETAMKASYVAPNSAIGGFAVAYGHVLPDGRLDAANSKNVTITQPNQSSTGLACLHVSVPITNMTAVIDHPDPRHPGYADGLLDGGIRLICPGANAMVQTIDARTIAPAAFGFWVFFS